MKSLLKFAVLLVIGILGYNYFFGTAEEKAQSKEIVSDVANAGKKIFKTMGNLLKDENQKFKEGKYDNALENIGDLLNRARDKARNAKVDIEGALDKLQDRKDSLKDALDVELSKDSPNQNKIDDLKHDFENLTKDIQNTLEKSGIEVDNK